MAGLTPSQTIGPFFHVALRDAAEEAEHLPDAIPTRIVIEGRVLDGSGSAVPDALIEVSQAQAFARAATDPDGRFVIETLKPEPVAGTAGRLQAPHLLVSVFARGILTRLATRMYFGDEPGGEEDPILQLVPAERRRTLVARRIGPNRYLFDVALQGTDETVFFEV